MEQQTQNHRRLSARGMMMTIVMSIISAATLLFGVGTAGIPVFILGVFLWALFSILVGHAVLTLVNFLTWLLYYYAIAMAITTLSFLFGMRWTKRKF